MRRTICLLLALLLAAATLSGCGQPSLQSFRADNEILTYQRVDPARTQLVVSRTGNIPVEQLCHAFEAENPDVQVIYLDITGGNSRYAPLPDWIAHGDLPDVVISAAGFLDDEITTSVFRNLSLDPIIQNYQVSALQRTSTDGEIYWLPGPSDISAMMYNKTLFQQYGWQVPTTFDQFVTLCDRITEDTDGAVEPWNPNAKYGNELTTALEAFTYAEVFGGLENRAWYDGVMRGEATLSGHLEPLVEVIDTLLEHGILREEHFSYSATTRGKEFQDGRIAMINTNIFDGTSEEWEFGYFPFPTTEGELGYLCDSYSCFVGVPEQKRSPERESAVSRFLEFFSSARGQEAYIGSSLKVSNVKDVPFSNDRSLAALQPALDAGHLFGILDFYRETIGESVVSISDIARGMCAGELDGIDCLAKADARLHSAPATAAPTAEVLTTAAEDFTILETSFLLADAYREIMGAQLGLITHGEAFRGNLMRIYAGPLTGGFVSVLKPRSFANDSALQLVSMTGSQILDALNHPVGNEKIGDCVYAYSGLRCRVAPWRAQGERYLSVTLADGSPLEPDTRYTVAVWEGTVDDAYVSEVLETGTGSWEELMEAYLSARKEIAPADDGRVTLVWD